MTEVKRKLYELTSQVTTRATIKSMLEEPAESKPTDVWVYNLFHARPTNQFY